MSRVWRETLALLGRLACLIGRHHWNVRVSPYATWSFCCRAACGHIRMEPKP